MKLDTEQLLKKTILLAQQAGEAILALYRQMQTQTLKIKADHSPLTEADLIAQDLIVNGLKSLTPELPIISEEATIVPFSQRQQWTHYWLVDPLDGTKEFIEGTDDFSVNIALIANHKPILGVIYMPVTACCYYASVGQGAFKQMSQQQSQRLHTAPWSSKERLKVTVSRRHAAAKLQQHLARFPDYEVLTHGSSLKFCLVAEGVADIYPRLGPTSEWDTAAGQCIVELAGGAVIDLNGKPLLYNTKESLENSSFIAVGDLRQQWLQYFKF